MDSLQVKGRRLDTEGGPRTRSRAKTQVEQWESIPLPLKLMVLLADALVEAQAQGLCAGASDDGDSDEWVDDDEEGGDERQVRADTHHKSTLSPTRLPPLSTLTHPPKYKPTCPCARQLARVPTHTMLSSLPTLFAPSSNSSLYTLAEA